MTILELPSKSLSVVHSVLGIQTIKIEVMGQALYSLHRAARNSNERTFPDFRSCESQPMLRRQMLRPGAEHRHRFTGKDYLGTSRGGALVY